MEASFKRFVVELSSGSDVKTKGQLLFDDKVTGNKDFLALTFSLG